MPANKEKVRWVYNPILMFRIMPAVLFVGTLVNCILMNWVVLNSMGVNVNLEDYLYAPWQLRGTVAYETTSGFRVDNTAWLFARPWVELSIYLAVGFATLEWQFSWVRNNENLMERFYTPSKHRELSSSQKLKAEIVPLLPSALMMIILLFNSWFYTALGIAGAVVSVQFFLYKDLNRIYQTAKNNIAKSDEITTEESDDFSQ